MAKLDGSCCCPIFPPLGCCPTDPDTFEQLPLPSEFYIWVWSCDPGTSECSCVNSDGIPTLLSWRLTYNSATEKWEGTGEVPGCGFNMTVKVYCLGLSGGIDDWVADIFMDCLAGVTGTGTEGTLFDLGRENIGVSQCNPLCMEFLFGGFNEGNTCCSGIQGEAFNVIIGTTLSCASDTVNPECPTGTAP